MLNSWRKHSYFHFHQLHNLYGLIMGLILFGLILLFLAMPAH